MLLRVDQLAKSFGGHFIFEGINFTLYPGDKLALIGPNGAGKTTLLRCLMDLIQADKGYVQRLGTIGYLPQNLDMGKASYLRNFLSQYKHHPAYHKTLAALGLKKLLHQPVTTLSGGEKTKAFLAKLLLEEPDLLLLDEPTNHLDEEGITYLEDYLQRKEVTTLLVSHDRYFINKVAKGVLSLEQGNLRYYKGTYDDYHEQKELEFQQDLAAYHTYVKTKQALEKAARQQMDRANSYNNMSQNDFYRGKATKISARSKAMQKRLAMLDEKEKPKTSPQVNTSFHAQAERRSGPLLLASELSITFDEPILKEASFSLEAGEKVALLGPNGSGKSSLLKAILGQVAYEGQLYRNERVALGYFSQELGLLQGHKTILEELSDSCQDQSLIRLYLGSMLFTPEDVFRSIDSLSYGEKVRVAFLKLILGQYPLLLLDEPTNFLDIDTRERLEEALMDFPGTILFVSHDRHFIKKLATKVLHLEDQQVRTYLGGYQAYVDREKRKERKSPDKLRLELRLSQLAYDLTTCKETEKEAIEAAYDEVAGKIARL